MRADPRFLNEQKSFWANVRSVSQHLGYTVRSGPNRKSVKVYPVNAIAKAMRDLGLKDTHILDGKKPTELGNKLAEYFAYRADILNNFVEPRLMDFADARARYEELSRGHVGGCPRPNNKQKGDKAGPAYLTCMVNMLIEQGIGDLAVNYNPLKLTTFTYDGAPLRTLSRRVDGAFPSTVNPIAIWEIKEYYYTTTFGSRIADGVYESQLDGLELEELEDSQNMAVEHLLIVDSRRTWWEKGRSYLCRIIDMLHMGYIDEVLFGREIFERIPDIVRGWVQVHAQRAPLEVAEPRNQLNLI